MSQPQNIAGATFFGGHAGQQPTPNVFMSSNNAEAGPSGTSGPHATWPATSVGGGFGAVSGSPRMAPSPTQPFFGQFSGRRGSYDPTPGRHLAPTDRPQSVGPDMRWTPQRSAKYDKLEPSPMIRRARSQYHSTSTSRASSPIPIPLSTPSSRSRDDSDMQPDNRRLSDMSDITDLVAPLPGENRPSSSRKSANGDAVMSTSASTESSSKAVGKQRLQEGRPPGPRIPPQLRATLMAEKDLPGQEMRSEALLQRFIMSNPASLPMTPRMPRNSQGRMLSSFSRANSVSSRSESSNDSSDDDIPFVVDEALDMEDGARRAVNWESNNRMDMDMGGGEGSVASTSDAGSGMNMDAPASVRRTPLYRPSINGLNAFGHMAMDEGGAGSGASMLSGSPRGEHVAPSMLWRESPSNTGRSAKRKAIGEDSRFEPYMKRQRGSMDAAHSPSQFNHNFTYPSSPASHPIPISPSSEAPMELAIAGPGGGTGGNGRAMAYARSRAGSPSAASVSLAMRAISPVASSPLSNGTGGQGANRPIIGMGGLGMLLLSKRNANAMSVGMGLMSGVDGESSAVAEGIGGMDVAAADQDEDEKMAD